MTNLVNVQEMHKNLQVILNAYESNKEYFNSIGVYVNTSEVPDGSKVFITNGKYIIKSSCVVEVYGCAWVEAYGNAIVNAFDSAVVSVRDNSVACAFGTSQVFAHGSSQVFAYGSAIVNAFDNVTAHAHGGAWVEW